jgi:ribosomal protein S18 acetylase RimI-like enzyme
LTFTGGFCFNRQVSEHQIRAVTINLLEALRFFGEARRDAEIQDLPGLSLIFCGLNYAAFNAALMAQPIDGDRGELVRLIESSAAQFDAKGLRWTYWLCDDFLSTPLRREAPRIFIEHGLRHLTEAPGMYADQLLPPKRQLPELEIRPVSDEATRGAFAEIMSTAFEIPHSVSNAIYGADRAWLGAFRGYVGYVKSKPVTTAAAVTTGGVIGLYSVATLPQHRRRGFAEAIMRQVIQDLSRRTGIDRTVLQATSSGLALYEAMGYRTVTKFDVYISD